jgi:hypoxanthine phosphoribosyltransferase
MTYRLSSLAPPTKQLVYPTEYTGHFKSLLIPADAIRQRVDVLAGLLAADYSGKRPVLVCTLKGACPFFVHLCDALQSRRVGYDLEFVRVSSYDGTDSTGTVAILGELKIDSLKDRHVIMVEDIVDTGTTLSTLLPLLQTRGGPASVQVCSLVDKRLADPSHKKYTAKYVGFSVPNAFIIGYG